MGLIDDLLRMRALDTVRAHVNDPTAPRIEATAQQYRPTARDTIRDLLQSILPGGTAHARDVQSMLDWTGPGILPAISEGVRQVGEGVKDHAPAAVGAGLLGLAMSAVPGLKGPAKKIANDLRRAP